MSPKKKSGDGLVQQPITAMLSPELESSPEPARTTQGVSHVVHRFGKKITLGMARQEALTSVSSDLGYDNLKASNRSLQKKLGQLKQENDILRIEKVKLPDFEELLKAGHAEDSFNFLKELVTKETEDYLWDLTSRHNKLKGTSKERRDQIDKLEAKITEAENRVVSEKAANYHLEARLTQQVESLRKENNNAIQEHKKLQDEKNHQIHDFKEQLQKANEKIQETEGKLQEIKGRLETFKIDEKHLRESYEKTRQEVLTEQESYAKLQTEHQTLQSSYNTMVNEMQMQTNNQEAVVKEMRDKHINAVAHLDSKIEELTHELAQKERETTDNAAKADGLEKKWREWAAIKLSDADGNHKRAQEDLQRALDNKINEPRTMQVQVTADKSKYDEECSQLKSYLEKSQENIGSKELLLRVLNEDIRKERRNASTLSDSRALEGSVRRAGIESGN
jgi:chromosome segregation ATPase